MKLPSPCYAVWRLTPSICKHVLGAQVKAFQPQLNAFAPYEYMPDWILTTTETLVRLRNVLRLASPTRHPRFEKTIPPSREYQGVIPVDLRAPAELDAGNVGATVIDSSDKSKSQVQQKTSDDSSKGSNEETKEDAWSWDEVDAKSEA